MVNNGNAWWESRYGNNKTCAITQSRLRRGKNKEGIPYSIKLECNHSFYTKALLQWIETGNNTCPLCRQLL